MIVYCVTVHVKPGHEDDFAAATVENHLNTRQEPGNLRFDVLRSADEPSKFFLYEVYDSSESVAAHKETAHYLKWRETVADWMEKPRERRMHHVVCPTGSPEW